MSASFSGGSSPPRPQPGISSLDPSRGRRGYGDLSARRWGGSRNDTVCFWAGRLCRPSGCVYASGENGGKSRGESLLSPGDLSTVFLSPRSRRLVCSVKQAEKNGREKRVSSPGGMQGMKSLAAGFQGARSPLPCHAVSIEFALCSFSFSTASSRILYFKILPAALVGKASTKST